MIVIDTSAMIAVMNHEPDRPVILDAISRSQECLISAVTLLEARIVAHGRFGVAGSQKLAEWLSSFSPKIVPFDEAQSAIAFDAFRQYGKGIHPTARLNFGDCASYALAKSRQVPLLFKGNDFLETDIEPAS